MEAATRIIEEALYEQVAKEISQGIRREGLWAKAIADSAGSAELARAAYIRLRVQSLVDEAELELAAKHKKEKQTAEYRFNQEQERIKSRIEELKRQQSTKQDIPIWVLIATVISIGFAIYMATR